MTPIARPREVPELPYVNFYCSDWLGDSKVRRMGAEARGLHIDLLCHSWQEPLPADQAELAEMLGVPARKLESLWPKLAPCWSTDGDQIINKRLEKERQKQRSRRGGGD